MARLFWTRELAIMALRREAERIGRTPGAHVLRHRECLAPSENVYRRLFGSLVAGQMAAGLVPNRHGGPLGWRKTHCKRGHQRTKENIDTQGHCRLCAVHWKSRQGRGAMLPRKVKSNLPTRLDLQRQHRRIEAIKAHWGYGSSHGAQAKPSTVPQQSKTSTTRVA